MCSPRSAGPAGGRRGPADPPRDDVASRVSAYVYGNVLVMAALIALHPDDLRGPGGVLSVLGVGASTFVAHAVGEAVGSRVREGRSLDAAALRHELRGALPIATAAGVPAALLTPAWVGVADADPVLVLVLALVDIRLALLGSVVAWMSGERSSGSSVPRRVRPGGRRRRRGSAHVAADALNSASATAGRGWHVRRRAERRVGARAVRRRRGDPGSGGCRRAAGPAGSGWRSRAAAAAGSG